uniref:DDE Tnp4 domain-containing protein n=1 Tax=Amphilophus citrinellus TaxID=61819 RepID=A0A3Q0RMK7_AMPCI
MGLQKNCLLCSYAGLPRDCLLYSCAGLTRNFLGTSIPPSLQVLITLRFLACGTSHRETADLCGVSESAVCKIVHKVYKAICKLRKDYIKFPAAVDQTTYKLQFYEYGNFSGVIGYAELYRNRKNWFSINLQGVSTPTLQFSNIVARWSGSTHDSRIFQNSSLCAQSEAGEHSGVLLGDGGYAQTHFLFTPYLHPIRPEQQCYNRAHIHTRGPVERMFGIWKNCFQCLRNTLHFEPRRCCIVIVATAVLHNYLKQHGCVNPPNEYYNDPHVPMELANDKAGHAYRNNFAVQHFS